MSYIKDIYTEPSLSYTYTELTNKIMEILHKNKKAAEYFIKCAIEKEIIYNKDSTYHLTL